jgi:broad specificity phosphatase PhoE
LYPGEVAYEDARLAEAQRGIWNSYTQEEVDRYFPLEESRKKCEGYYHYRPPGGENWPDIELRILSFINCLRRDYAGKRVLVVTHGNWLVLFQRLVEHLSVDEALKRYEKGHFRNASVTVYEAPWRFPTGRSNLILREENIVPWEKD